MLFPTLGNGKMKNGQQVLSEVIPEVVPEAVPEAVPEPVVESIKTNKIKKKKN